METFKAISKYSNLHVFKNLEDWEAYLQKCDGEVLVIQVAITSNNNLIVETVFSPLLEKYRNETKIVDKTEEKVKTKQEQDLENALDTVLNKDPFGDVYSGWKLKDIVDTDPEWIDKAIKDLKNTFIKDKLILIKNNYR